jgi:hypothetical protein
LAAAVVALVEPAAQMALVESESRPTLITLQLFMVAAVVATEREPQGF